MYDHDIQDIYSLKLPYMTSSDAIHKRANINLLKDRRQSHMEMAAYIRLRDDKYIDHRLLRTRLWDGSTLKVNFPHLSLYQKSLEYNLATV